MPLHLVEHPLVHDALMELRDARTPPAEFRRAASRISVLLAAEALRGVPSTPGHGRNAGGSRVRPPRRR